MGPYRRRTSKGRKALGSAVLAQIALLRGLAAWLNPEKPGVVHVTAARGATDAEDIALVTIDALGAFGGDLHEDDAFAVRFGVTRDDGVIFPGFSGDAESLEGYALHTQEDLEARETAAAVVEALGNVRYPMVSEEAAGLFNDLAAKTPMHYSVGLWAPEGTRPQYAFLGTSDAVVLRSHTPQVLWLGLLVDFFKNPHRDRLRRCPVCARWFLDETRNRSARRCSRRCTIAWSNTQRGQRRALNR